MSFLSSFDISASGLTAERQRLDIAAENLSNTNTTRRKAADPIGERWWFCRKYLPPRSVQDLTAF